MTAQTTEPSRLAALPLLDEAAIAALRDPELGGDPEFLVEVVEAFLGDSPPRLQTLRASLEGGDAEAIGRAAHSLKGSCASLGAAQMAALCARLEAMGRGLAPNADAAEVFAELERQYGLVRLALERERNATH